MNKNELITFLRNPNDLKESDLGELEKIIENNPYFLNGRLLLAKGSKELKHPDTRNRVTSAAVYSTDRPLFKKYLSDKLFFLSKPPEEEEIVLEETKPEPKKEVKTESQSQKIEVLDSPKEENAKIEKPEEPKEAQSSEEKPRREPRFDPSATASFKRRWDVKSDSESVPKSKGSDTPSEKVQFVGKKIDRSNRVKKKSIREELLDDGSPKKKTPRPEAPEPIQETPKPIERKEAAPEIDKKPQEEVKKEPAKSTPDKEKEITSSATSEETKRQPVKSIPDEKKEVANTDASEKPKAVETKKESTSFFDDDDEITAPQKKAETTPPRPQPTSKPTPPKQVVEEKEHVPVVIRKTSKPGLNVPEVPSGGIDAILEELQRDMENLKSSRVKFTEVQQKIEEDDAVSAAVERATKKIPTAKTETAEDAIQNDAPKEEEPNKAEQLEKPKNEENLEVSSSKSEEISDEKKVKDSSKVEAVSEEVKEEDPSKSEEAEAEKVSSKEKKKEVEEKPKEKKSTSEKKKAVTKKEAATKKVTPKKTKTAKTAAKPKSSKTKSTKKEEKKEDDKSGKPKVDQHSIIDKFIAETPSIKYQKKGEPVENQDLSDQSTEWNKELASEYLAEIYLHQGNKKRAIEIYTALSLKFPNKKSYFADLISKTK